MRYTARMPSPSRPTLETPLASELFSAIVATPFGGIGVRTTGDRVSELVYLPPRFGEKAPQDVVAEQAASQLERYLDDAEFAFDLPLAEVGSAYQQKVWAAIASIPRGSVRTYGQVASSIGSAPRAVGQACGANWFPIVVPCHRVTATGGLGGFANHDDENGFHLSVKRWLLTHEGATFGPTPWQQQAIWT
jgi:methylated-DNA-[protein]-cysteine S-methyltransferase